LTTAKESAVHTPIERLIRRLTADERLVILVGGLIIAAMLSAITLDRLLAARTTPTVITLAAPRAVEGDSHAATSHTLTSVR
jgi:hypothetical protein